ncbi:MAG: hypothetical protein EOP24_34505 [Hyphomicrobiales bacterium]|nr:MAG: hypothetical protein EOP24_34505 [Hyphomicrobiales bacterium]
MRKPKSYQVSSVAHNRIAVPGTFPEALAHASSVFELEVNAASRRKVDFGAYLGAGIDAWIWAGLTALRAFSSSGAVSPRTILNYAGSGWPRWLDFLIESHGPSTPPDLRPEHVQNFVLWLRRKYPLGTSAHTTYAQTKPMLVATCELGMGPSRFQDLFPVKALVGRAGLRQSPLALSHAEILRLAGALKKDLIAIHRSEFRGPDSEALTVSFLVIALRTGINTTPLLEAARDCLSPNPFIPNVMVMRTVKRRGKGQQTNPMRQSDGEQGTTVIPMDGVAVLRGVIFRTECLSAEAPPKLRDRIWLYRSRSRKAQGELLTLSESALDRGIRRFVKRHGLLDDDGKLLTPTPTRLRKTMETKLWKLSDGDLLAVAASMGHTADVADKHYLSLTSDMKVDAARFVGLALPEVLRGKETVQPFMPVSIRKTIQNTPVGKCASSLHGKRAPKNGVDHCDRFTECLTCPTYVVVGSLNDLHRLFSFQLFLQSEIEYMVGPDMGPWRDHNRRLMALIDRFTAARFAESVVEEARSSAITKPHPFWAARMRSVTHANGRLHAG